MYCLKLLSLTQTILTFKNKLFDLHITCARIFPKSSKLFWPPMASAHFYHVHKMELSQESLKVPGKIIHFELSVIDTNPDEAELPTVVGIHGSPGCAGDFEPLIQHLSDKNIRFLGPTFPGFESSEVDSWKLYHLDYSSEGRMQLMEQILKKAGINRISVLLCHSAGSWLGCKIAAESDLVKSLCFLNPACVSPHRSLRPQFVVHSMAWLLRRKSLHFVLMPLVERVYAYIGFSGVKGGEHLMVAQQIVSSQNFHDTKIHAKKIQEKQLPLVFAYTLNDKIIEVLVSEEMLFQHLNVPKELVTVVDSSKNQTSLSGTTSAEGDENARFVRGLQFERGGHIVHKAYPEIILRHILQLLAHVENARV